MDFSSVLESRLVDFGLTLDDVARRARVATARLHALKDGRTPNVDELQRLARVLVFDPYALIRGERLDDPRRSPARFKRPAGSSEALSPRDVLLLARAAEVSRIGGWLAQTLGRELALVALRGVEAVRPNEEAWRQGYTLGGRARDRIAGGPEPIHSVQRVLERAGVHVALVSFDSELIAAAIYEPSAMPLVLLNRNAGRVHRPLSRRASLAHELCHLLHDGGERDLVTVTASVSHDDIEQRANGFAPAFIAHPNSIRDEHQRAFQGARLRDEIRAAVLDVARRWGFTPEGAIWHAKNCELIGESEAAELLTEAWPVLEQQFEPAIERADITFDVDVDDLVRGLYSDFVIAALTRDEISEAKARELLSQ